jgi:hypothetical protein
MRHTAARCFLSMRAALCFGRFPQLGKNPGADRTGRNLGYSLRLRGPKSANRQRATNQTPQGLDAQHGGEVFPVNESCAAPHAAGGASAPSSGKPGTDRTGVEIWVAGRSPSPKPQTGNAQQRRRHKALMRNTVARCFPSPRSLPAPVS